MGIEYSEVIGLAGSILAKHPGAVGLAMSTAKLWRDHMDELAKAYADYVAAAAQGKGPLDTAGVIMGVAAKYPAIEPLIEQTLTMWQGRAPEVIQILSEFQAGSAAAQKS